MTSAIPAVNSSVLPGQRLCAITAPTSGDDSNRRNHTGGPGTYEHQGYIHASLAGRLSVRKVDHEGGSDGGENKSGKNGMSVIEVSVIRYPFIHLHVIARDFDVRDFTHDL